MIRLNAACLSRAAIPAVLAMAGALSLGACVPAPRPTSGDQAALQACRQRAEAIYAQQNRVNLYRTDTLSAPYGSTGLPSDTSAGLSQRYGYDTVVQNCLRGSEANTEIGTGAASGAAAPSPSAVRPANAEPLAGPAPGAPLSAPPPGAPSP